MLAALSQAIESRPYMRGHGPRVTALAERVAIRLGWHGERLSTLREGTRIHDIGKLAVADHILRKPGSLTPVELEQIRRHPVAGARMIEPLESYERVLPYVLFHHERWDGGGYPSGRAGREIPIEARIVAVADAFDAMVSRRPYRDPLAYDDALSEVARCAGTQFDPEVARLFLDAWAASSVAATA